MYTIQASSTICFFITLTQSKLFYVYLELTLTEVDFLF